MADKGKEGATVISRFLKWLLFDTQKSPAQVVPPLDLLDGMAFGLYMHFISTGTPKPDPETQAHLAYQYAETFYRRRAERTVWNVPEEKGK